MRWEKLFKPHILERGNAYYQEGAVTEISIDEDKIEATVEGSEKYFVAIDPKNGQAEDMECTCPYGYHMHYLPNQEAVNFLPDAFAQMSQASLNLNRDPGICQCELRQQAEMKIEMIEKEKNIMRIAVTYDNGEIFQHFGHTEQFKLYDVQDGKIVNEQVVNTNGSGHGALAGFLQAAQADALICGGIGMGAQMALADAGVKLYAGVQGSADEAAKALAEGRLEYDPEARCEHHEHHGGDCGHEHCAEHQCGGN